MLGSCLHLQCAVVVGCMDVLTEAKTLIGRPHVIIATPERVKVLLEENSNIQVEQHTNERSKPYIKGNYGD